MQTDLTSFEPGGLAVVIGATGGIGAALVAHLKTSAKFSDVIALSRSSTPSLDLEDEQTIDDCAVAIGALAVPIRLVIVATGLLHDATMSPEKGLRQLAADPFARAFAVNATGPALVAKHFLPLLPRTGKTVFAALSAKVGSIGDNQLGGWYAYRAAKAALNQLLHTAAIEIARNRPAAICLTLHPGTVDTRLSAPFHGPNHPTVTPDFAAERLLGVIDAAQPAQTGQFLDHTGVALPW